jgi:predicted RNA binding protein YcfA (HicA-like mRNA interferase family)
MTSGDIIRRLQADGWALARIKGDHHIFTRAGSMTHVTVPHPKKDLPRGTLRNIFRQAGWPWPPQT